MCPVLQVTLVRTELEKLKRDHEQLKAELSKVHIFTQEYAPRVTLAFTMPDPVVTLSLINRWDGCHV